MTNGEILLAVIVAFAAGGVLGWNIAFFIVNSAMEKDIKRMRGGMRPTGSS